MGLQFKDLWNGPEPRDPATVDLTKTDFELVKQLLPTEHISVDSLGDLFEDAAGLMCDLCEVVSEMSCTH